MDSLLPSGLLDDEIEEYNAVVVPPQNLPRRNGPIIVNQMLMVERRVAQIRALLPLYPVFRLVIPIAKIWQNEPSRQPLQVLQNLPIVMLVEEISIHPVLVPIFGKYLDKSVAYLFLF